MYRQLRCEKWECFVSTDFGIRMLQVNKFKKKRPIRNVGHAHEATDIFVMIFHFEILHQLKNTRFKRDELLNTSDKVN